MTSPRASRFVMPPEKQPMQRATEMHRIKSCETAASHATGDAATSDGLAVPPKSQAEPPGESVWKAAAHCLVLGVVIVFIAASARVMHPMGAAILALPFVWASRAYERGYREAVLQHMPAKRRCRVYLLSYGFGMPLLLMLAWWALPMDASAKLDADGWRLLVMAIVVWVLVVVLLGLGSLGIGTVRLWGREQDAEEPPA